MVANAAQSTDVTLLRPPRRDVTRGRICAAAREVFLRSGYGAATLEHIALEAGLRRSTLYNHFRDKGEILAAIADDYLGAVTGVIGRLPPRPSRRQIDYWIDEFAEFVLVERAPTLLFVSVTAANDAPPSIHQFGERLMTLFAGRVPAFAEALQPGQERAFARALAVLRELGWALCYHVEHEGRDLSPYKLEVAADLLEQFVKGWF